MCARDATVGPLRDPGGTQAGPGRDPGGTRAGPGRGPGPQGSRTEVIRRSVASRRAAGAQAPLSDRSAECGTAFRAHRTVRRNFSKWLHLCAESVVLGPSWVPSGSQPGPKRDEKERFCTYYALIRCLKLFERRHRAPACVPIAPRSRRADPTGTIPHQMQLL